MNPIDIKKVYEEWRDDHIKSFVPASSFRGGKTPFDVKCDEYEQDPLANWIIKDYVNHRYGLKSVLGMGISPVSEISNEIFKEVNYMYADEALKTELERLKAENAELRSENSELLIRNMLLNKAKPTWWRISLKIKRVIFENPATIVFWMDGTKTVVKAQNDDIYDREKGLAMAYVKKMLGNKGNYYNHIKKHLEEKDDDRSI